MTVRWKSIAGYHGYEVSTDGRVRKKRKDGSSYELKQNIQDGNPRVKLKSHSKYTYIGVHKLMAEAFLPNPSGYPIAYHVNGDPMDNSSIDNIAWGNRSDVVRGKVTVKFILQISTVDGKIHRYSSIQEAADLTGVSHAGISRALRGIRITSGGFIWMYDNHLIDKKHIEEHTSRIDHSIVRKQCKCCGKRLHITEFKLVNGPRSMHYDNYCKKCSKAIHALRTALYSCVDRKKPFKLYDLYREYKHFVDKWTIRGRAAAEVIHENCNVDAN